MQIIIEFGRFSMSVATVRSRIINFYAKKTKMAAVEIFFPKKEFFWLTFRLIKIVRSKFSHNPRSNSSHTCAEYVYKIS